MRHYRLVYKQPYEYDDDSPSGIGDHNIEYTQMMRSFEACNDIDARAITQVFLAEGGLNFGFHIGSPPAGFYPRRFVSLNEFRHERAVKYPAQVDAR